MSNKKRALLTASRKDEKLIGFAQQLAGIGFELLASAGTQRFLAENNAPAIDVAELVGEPILGHRLVTLGPGVLGGLLSKLGDPNHMAELEPRGIKPIHLVYVDLYPLKDHFNEWLKMTIVEREQRAPGLIEMIDIGGPTLLRSASKGGRWAVSNADQFEGVINALLRPYDDHRQLMWRLASQAEYAVRSHGELAENVYRTLAEGVS